MELPIKMSEFRTRRALTNADYFPALIPEYAHRRPEFGLGQLEPPPHIAALRVVARAILLAPG